MSRVKGLMAQKNTMYGEKERGIEKKGENSFLVAFNRFMYVYVCLSVCVWVHSFFGAVLSFKPSLFYEPFFIRHNTHLLYSWEFRYRCFFYLYKLFIGCRLIEVEFIHTHSAHNHSHKEIEKNFENYWFVFILLFLFHSSTSFLFSSKRKELCVFAFEIIHDQFML